MPASAANANNTSNNRASQPNTPRNRRDRFRRFMSALMAMTVIGGTLVTEIQPVAAATPDAADSPAAAPAPAGATDGTAAFTWSVPQRFGPDANNDHVIDMIDTPQEAPLANPTSWPVDFDACEANGQPRANATYSWTFGTDPPTAPSTQCTITHSYPAVNTAYDVSLTVVDSTATATTTQSIVPRDYVVVIMGDSAASGEGNPDYLDADWTNGSKNAVFAPKWNNEQCHRSALSGQAQAALRLEQRDPHSSVTFIDVACSGARITRGILSPYQGIVNKDHPRADCDDPNLANPYKPGQTFYIKYPDPALDPPNPQAAGCLPAQIDQVKAIVGPREIDSVSIVAGINDLFFSKPIMACLIEDDCTTAHSTVLRDPQDRLQTAAEFIAPRMAQLQDRYAALFSTVMSQFSFRTANPALGITAGHVFLAEYPNSGQNPDGTPCDSNELGLIQKAPTWVKTSVSFLLQSLATSPDAGHFSAKEWGWATQNILTPLNAAGQTAVAAANTLWPGRISVVTGSTHAFDAHGYCSPDPWMQSVGTSFLYQRDPEGSFHPNRAGHFFGYALPLESALATQLGVTAPALPPTVGGDIETLEAISQTWAPFLDVMGRTNIVEQLDKIFPIQPGLPSKKGTDWGGIIDSIVSGVAKHVGGIVAAKGLSEADVLLDDLDGVNGPTNDGQIGDFVVDVSGEISPHGLADQYALDVHISATGPAASLNWSMAGLTLAGEGSNLTLDTTLHFVIEPGRTDGFRAYLPIAENPGFTVRLTAQQELPAAAATTAQLGPIDVVVHGPAGGKAVDIDTGLTLSLSDPDGDGKITIDEITGASASSLFNVSCTTGSHVDVDVAVDGGLPGLTTNIARMQLHDNNVCNGIDAPTFTFAQPNWQGIANLGPNDVLDLANALANAIERLQAAGDLPVPFTADQLRDALDLVNKIRLIAQDPANSANLSIQRLVSKLEAALGMAPGSMNLRFDQATNRFLFDLVINPSVTNATLPVDLGLLAKAGLLSPDSSATVSVSANAAITLHLALDVTPDPAGTTTENLRGISDRLLISTDSSATFDASATVKANATATVGLLPVDITLDNGSGGAQSLIAKRDPSKPLASITISGPGQWVSLADLLSGDVARASVNASLNAKLNPTTISARSVLGTTEIASGHVTVSWNDLTQLTGADGPQVTADAAFGASIARFIEAANDPIELLNLILGGVRDSATAAVDLARNNEKLARALPLVGKGYDDVVAGFAAIGKAADDIAKLHAKLTLPQIEQALETALAQALGVSPASVADKISLALDTSKPRTALVLHIDLCQASAASAACSAVRPVQGSFSLDANGLGFVGTNGQTSVSLDYLARLKIDLALELPGVNLPDATHSTPYIADGDAPAGIYVLGSTGVDVQLGASANGVVGAFVGPFAASLGITGTKDGQPYNDPATINAKIAFRVSSGGPADERLTPGDWLTKVQQNLTANGVTQPISGACTTPTDEGCARLPVYFKTAAGTITAPDGTKWVQLGTAPVTFTAAHLLDPATYNADVPQSVLDDLQNQAFSVTSIITAIRYVLDQAKVSLDGAKIGQQLPIVGDAYAAGSSLLADLDALAAKLQDLSAKIEQQTSAGNVRTTIKSWLLTNLGPSSSLKLILDRNGDAKVDANDIDVIIMCGAAACADSQSLLDITDVKLVVSIGRTATASSPAIDFGVKGLQIKSDSPASASIGWHLDLALGVDDSGVYVDPAGVGNRPELGVSVDASLPQNFDATILGLPIKITDTHTGQDVDIDLGVDVLGDAGTRLRLPQLLSRGDNPNDRGALGFTIKGCADLNVGFEVAVPGLDNPDALPSVQGDIAFHTDWNGCPSTPGAGRDLRDGFAPTAKFSMKNLRIDAGKLATKWVGKVAKEIQRVTSPLQPVINTIQQPIPVISDLAKLVGKDQITWLEAWAAGQQASGNDVTAVLTIIKLLDFVNTFNANGAPTVGIPIADDFDIDLSQAQYLFADPDVAFDKLIAGSPVVKDVFQELKDSGWDIKTKIDAVADKSKGASFTFPALEKPSLLLQMLFGKDVDLAVFDAGTLHADNDFDYYYGLPFAKVGVRGAASIDGHLALSYDTAGIRRTVATKPLKWSSLGALVHGFGINDLDSKGNDVPEIKLAAHVGLYAYAGVPGANISAEGGVEGVLTADLIDPDGDGKVRYDEIKNRITNPRCIFDTEGKIDVYARVIGELGPFTGTKDIVKPYTLWEFSSIESWCQQLESSGGGSTPVPPPVLAEVSSSNSNQLTINVGSRANLRNLGGSPDESVTVTDLGDGRVDVSMLGITQTYGSVAKPITNVFFYSGTGNDKLATFGPNGPGTANLVFSVQAGPGNDVIQGGDAADLISGDGGDDTIDGRGGNDTLIGGDGNDTIDGGAGGDTINGDTSGNPGGNDVIDGGDGDDRIFPMDGMDTVFGGLGNDVIDGRTTYTNGVATGPDRLEGGEGNDGIYGSSGNDVIIGGVNSTASAGIHDTLWGNEGDDCIVADNGTASIETVNGVSTCVVVLADDTINEQDNVLGGKGSDTIFGGGGNDRLDGDDEVNLDVGNDVIDGGTGNDTILGAGGDDTLLGAAGDDNLSGENGNDHLSGGDGVDTLSGGNDDDEVLGGAGNDTATGDSGNDTVIGDEGDDKLDGFVSSLNNPSGVDGNDVVDGGPGNDIALAGPGNDRVSGGTGDDTLSAETGDDTIVGGSGNDSLNGGAGNDLLRGGDGDDRIVGRAGNDRLEGGNGNDLLGGDTVTWTNLSPATFPSGAPHVSATFDLNIGGTDTYDGGSGDDFVYDVALDPPSEVQRQSLSLTITDPADHGSAAGTVVGYLYTPATGYKGDDQIGFQIKLNSVVTNTGTIVISNGQNSAPVATDDTAITDRGLAVQGNLLTNDTDPNGDVLDVVPASGTTAGGTYSVVAGGGFTYTPAPAFAGATDSFTYTAKDPDGATDTATVTITIRPDYIAPVVVCPQPAGWSGTEVTVHCTASDPASGLADAGQAGFDLTTALGAGNEGPAAIDAPAVCDTSSNCTDLPSFDVLVDRKGPSITSANDGKEYTIGSAVTRDVTCADGGSGLAAPCLAGLVLDTTTLGAHTFQVTAADAVFNTTTATFTYTVVGAADVTAPTVSCPQPAGWSAAEVTVHCTASDAESGLANGGQAAFDLTSALGAGKEGSFSIDPPAVCDVAGNCTDLPAFTVLVDRQGPSITSANNGQSYVQGTAVQRQVTCVDGGSGLAAPCSTGQALDTSTAGPHSFVVQAADLVGSTTTMTFTYTVTAPPPPPNRAPVAQSETVDTDQAKAVSGNVLTNDSDPDGDPIKVNLKVVHDTKGDLLIGADGSFTFTPRANFVGDATYGYIVSDNRGGSANAFLTIRVHADTTAPAVSCPAPTGWSAAEVTVHCTATDAGTGIGGSSQITFDLTTNEGAGNEGGFTLDPQPVCDGAGNCTDVPPFTVLVDRKAPQVSSANAGVIYSSDQVGVTKQVSCTDSGSGLTTPTCPQDGEPLDLTPGDHTYYVAVADAVGNSTTLAVWYTVEDASIIRASVLDTQVLETNRNVLLRIPVVLSAPSTTKVVVYYAVVPGTAGSKDASIPRKGKLVFLPNRRTKLTPTVMYINVTIKGDRLREDDETFLTGISSTSVVVKQGEATTTIIDDDSRR